MFTAVVFQLNDVNALTVTEENDVIHQIKDLCEYAEEDYREEVKISSIVYPLEVFKSMREKAIKNQELCKLRSQS